MNRPRSFNRGQVLAYGEACVGAGKAAARLPADATADSNIEIAARLLTIIDEMAPQEPEQRTQ